MLLFCDIVTTSNFTIGVYVIGSSVTSVIVPVSIITIGRGKATSAHECLTTPSDAGI